jgi:ATP-dependent DNA helicase RecG
MVEPLGNVAAPSSTLLELDDPLTAIDRRLASRRTGVREKGPEAHEVLADMGIRTVGDLLRHYPRRYVDRSTVQAIRDLRSGEPATVLGLVRSVRKRPIRGPGRRTLVTVTLTDGTGELDLTFFNQPWTASTYRPGSEVAAWGIATRYGRRLQLANQEAELLRSQEHDLVHTGRITPIHPAAEGVSTRTIRELVHRALERLPRIDDPLPTDVVRDEGLEDLDHALRSVHFPEGGDELRRAIERLKFDELFVLELGVAFRKHRVESERTGVPHRVDGELTERLAATLPFEPTKAQARAIEDVAAAMAAPRPMNVLLQGDVGSGKTLVAVHACLVAIQSGHQAAIMAPTEVLAGQHLRSVASLLERVGAVPFLEGSATDPRRSSPPGQASLLDEAEDGPFEGAPAPSLTYALLTSAVTGADRTRIVAGVADGAVDLVVGTHALVQESVSFRDLSLAVVDEQHRFGLHQRMALKAKGGGGVDVLIMTATPIPRTLALTYYGDLDVVTLDELPKGRRPPPTTSSGARSAPDARPSWSAPRSTRGTAPRSGPPRARRAGSRPRCSRTSASRSCTDGCDRRRRTA